MEAVSDAHLLCKEAVRCLRNDSLKLWGGFGLIAFGAFWLCSSGDFSFILTLSSLVSLFCFLTVAVTIEARQSAQGISCRMMECYCLVFSGRLCAIVPFEGYLPFDSSGDWLYQVCEASSLCLAGLIVYLCRVRHARTYNVESDTLNNLWLIVPALVASLVIHPHLNNHTAADVAWAFALYLESFAMLCQLSVFGNEYRAETHMAHFLAGQTLSKLMSFIFWSASFSELINPAHYIKCFVGTWVIGMQALQILIMVDFIHNYLFCMRYGISMSRVCCPDETV